MLKKLILAAGLALTLAIPAHADPQKFTTEDSATKFCKAGNVVWYNQPGQQNLFPAGIAVLRQDKERRLYVQSARR